MIGETIAHYRITAKLGEGGMGELYHARETNLKCEAAPSCCQKTFAGGLERMALDSGGNRVYTVRQLGSKV
jgi:hypothetical protein